MDCIDGHEAMSALPAPHQVSIELTSLLGPAQESTLRKSYKYQPLRKDGQTRYVRLLPGSPGARIRCKLFAGCIATRPDNTKMFYIALSYTWGNGTLHSIDCDGARLDISENLWLALQRLRLRSEPRVLWIDAICINQQNMDEKASHLNHMRDIYANASQVVVYLGEPESQDLTGSEVLKIFNFLEQLARHLPPERDQVVEPMNKNTLELLGFPSPDDPAWSSLSTFFRRPWFSRVWVLQEICQAVARKTVVMACGCHSVHFNVFALAVDYIQWRQISRLTGVNVLSMTQVLAVVRQHWLHSILVRRDHTDERVLVMLCRSRNTFSTNPLDKVFGT